MRTAIVLLALLLIATVATANPIPYWPAVNVMFANDGSYVPRVDPALFEEITAYVTVSCPSSTFDNLASISFAIDIPLGMGTPPVYSSLLPGGQVVGAWESGITLLSTEPVYDGVIYVCSIDFIYIGQPGLIRVLEHPNYPLWVTNGDGFVVYYCVGQHGGVLMDPPIVDYGCFFCEETNPVENVSWGAIKSLYR